MEAVTVGIAVATAANMLRSPMLRADTVTHVGCAAMSTVDTHVLVFEAGVVTVLSATRAMQDVHISGIAAPTGAVVDTGEVVFGIRTMDIPGLATTVWATAIQITGITVTHIITDIIPTD